MFKNMWLYSDINVYTSLNKYGIKMIKNKITTIFIWGFKEAQARNIF